MPLTPEQLKRLADFQYNLNKNGGYQQTFQNAQGLGLTADDLASLDFRDLGVGGNAWDKEYAAQQNLANQLRDYYAQNASQYAPVPIIQNGQNVGSMGLTNVNQNLMSDIYQRALRENAARLAQAQGLDAGVDAQYNALNAIQKVDTTPFDKNSEDTVGFNRFNQKRDTTLDAVNKIGQANDRYLADAQYYGNAAANVQAKDTSLDTPIAELQKFNMPQWMADRKKTDANWGNTLENERRNALKSMAPKGVKIGQQQTNTQALAVNPFSTNKNFVSNGSLGMTTPKAPKPAGTTNTNMLDESNF